MDATIPIPTQSVRNETDCERLEQVRKPIKKLCQRRMFKILEVRCEIQDHLHQ